MRAERVCPSLGQHIPRHSLPKATAECCGWRRNHTRLFLLPLDFLEAVIIPSLLYHREGDNDLAPVVGAGTRCPHPV